MIVHEAGRYVVKSQSGRSLGSYATRHEAERRLAEVEMFKAMRRSERTTERERKR